MIPIRILPISQLQETGEKYDSKNIDDCEPYDSIYGFANGKQVISYLLEEYGLKRNDEVYIDTTSGINYVSSCVTCTVFNFCKPSRVISQATKMIYVIHEFGILNKKVFELKELGEKLNIPLVEDVAHSISSFSDGVRLGEIGDFGIFSLPKFLPVKSGGLLTTKLRINKDNDFYDDTLSSEVKSVYQEFSGDVGFLAARRTAVYRKFVDQVKIDTTFYDLKDQESPFLVAFETNKAKAIKEVVRNAGLKVEFFPMHRADILAIPTNCFLQDEQIETLSVVINDIL